MADRFALKFHRETQELSAYLLVVEKGGSKLTKSSGDPNAGSSPMFGVVSAIRLPAKNASIDDFIHVVQRNMVDRPIVDRTGCTGKVDFTLTFTPNAYQVATMGGACIDTVDTNCARDTEPDDRMGNSTPSAYPEDVASRMERQTVCRSTQQLAYPTWFQSKTNDQKIGLYLIYQIKQRLYLVPLSNLRMKGDPRLFSDAFCSGLEILIKRPPFAL